MEVRKFLNLRSCGRHGGEEIAQRKGDAHRSRSPPRRPTDSLPIRLAVVASRHVCRVGPPDVAGWRRERLPEAPTTFPVELSPDWVCEVCAARNARRRDSLQKRRIYAERGVPYHWLIDLVDERLVVLHLVDGVYQEILDAGRSERTCAPPFDALELPTFALFGDDVE